MTDIVSTRISFNRPGLGGNEFEYIREAVEGAHTSLGGPFTARVVELLSEWQGSPDVLLTTSCTDALEMTALLLDIEPGDTVIVPSFTFVSSALAFVRAGARLLFADIEPVTLGIDPAHVSRLIDDSVRAVVAVHYAGIGCDIDGLRSVLQPWPNVDLIEDNAQGLFGEYRDEPLGSFGRFSTISFHETKNFICGEGGALVVNHPDDVDRAHVLLNKGTDRRAFMLGQVDKYSWKDIGSSFGLSDMLAAYLFAQATDARHILSLGGLASGLPAELLRYPVVVLDQVEQDRRGFERIRPYLPQETRAALADRRMRVHDEDGRNFLRELAPTRRYDLILALHAVPSNAAGNRFFTEELYREVAAHLSPRGVFCTRVDGASNYVGRTVGSYAGSVYQTLSSVFAEVAIQPGDVLIICAALTPGVVTEKPVVLERRLSAIPVDGDRFPADAFYSMMPADGIAYLRERFDAADAAINRDDRPVTYYLNMLLWGRFSASGFVDWMESLHWLGPWPYLLPFGLLLLLGLLRSGIEGNSAVVRSRRAGTFALFLLGVVAMALQLAVLLGYQSRVGFMFERFALLNGLFMAGLALGAVAGLRFAGDRMAAWVLMGLLTLIGAGGLTLPLLFDWLAGLGPTEREIGFWGLCVAAGLLTGSGFPLGVSLARGDDGDALSSGGLAQAADNAGGSIGGLVTGALMVPILGIAGTVAVLAALCGLAVVALGAAQISRGLSELSRSDTSLPWPNLSWMLLFSVVLIYGWTWLAQGGAPGPRVQFETQGLQAVSGSENFEQQDQPFVHYLGSGRDGAVETAVLSTMAAAPDIRGFAGPVNLLLAVDRGGLLRGVRYVTSHETPSYIDGIDTWLAGLAGADLGSGPLSLGQVDALSGATVTSRAALEAINRSASRVSRLHFGNATPALSEESRAPVLDPAFWVTMALLLLFIPVYLSGSERGRLLFQLLSFGILGLWLNTLVTEIDLINLSLGHVAAPAQNPQRWLLLGFVAVSGLLFGQVWCGYVCPFGILQEWVSRIGRWTGLRAYPDRHLEQPLRYVKFVMLSLMLSLVWLADDAAWAGLDPMQSLFSGDIGDWMLLLSGLVLLACLYYVRFWCRYLCPIGAFLALSNRLALLRRFAPARRFEHCDLGVKAEHDLDCIRCNRCLTGADTRLKPRDHGRQPDIRYNRHR